MPGDRPGLAKALQVVKDKGRMGFGFRFRKYLIVEILEITIEYAKIAVLSSRP